MDLAAIPEIRVETVGDEVAYWLPVRSLGKLRWIGLIPVGFSALWIWTVGHMLLDVIRPFSHDKPAGVQYFMAAVLAGFALMGCGPAGFGLLAMFGRCRVRWREGRLAVSDFAGPFAWRRRLPRKTIRKFLVQSGLSSNGRPVIGGPLGDMAVLVAEFETGKPRIVAAGYPREWLQAIASDLSMRTGRSQAAPPRVEEIHAGENQSLLEEAAEKPSDSKVVLQRQPASIVLDVPPAGLRKGSMGLFFFATAWCVFMVLFTLAVCFGKRVAPGNDFLGLMLFLGGFWSVGLGMMAAAINLGKRRATLTAGRSGLTVVQSGPFGVKRREFRREEIATVRVAAGNVEINHSRVPELQIHPVTGKKVGLLIGRDPAELRWMAAELKKALGL
jgi:hypothetical protein